MEAEKSILVSHWLPWKAANCDRRHSRPGNLRDRATNKGFFSQSSYYVSVWRIMKKVDELLSTRFQIFNNIYFI